MSTSTTGGLTSIIVPCCNQVDFTELCLQALFRLTRPAWELIIIDNGSTDGTGLYLGGVRDAAAVPVTVICNDRNLGFPRAINQGLQAASGEYLVLLNNDAVVTDGWLDQLIALSALTGHAESKVEGSHAEDAEDAERRTGGRGEEEGSGGLAIGLVGPMTNYAPPPQLVEDVPYGDLDQMHAFARRWRDEHRGVWFTVGKLSGFCLLMKRDVYEAVGGLDERFGLGLFDDDDLALRARRAGFELAVAHDLFVHHFGSRTFVGHGIDAERLLEENGRRFAAKWGVDTPVGRRVSLRAWDGGAGSRIPDAGFRTEGTGSGIEDRGLEMEGKGTGCGEGDGRSKMETPSIDGPSDPSSALRAPSPRPGGEKGMAIPPPRARPRRGRPAVALAPPGGGRVGTKGADLRDAKEQGARIPGRRCGVPRSA